MNADRFLLDQGKEEIFPFHRTLLLYIFVDAIANLLSIQFPLQTRYLLRKFECIQDFQVATAQNYEKHTVTVVTYIMSR